MDIPENITDDEDFLELIEIVMNPSKPKTYRSRPDNFFIWNDAQFLQRFRLSKQTVRIIIDEISTDIKNETLQNHGLTPDDMVFITLRCLNTGTFLQVVGDLQGIDKGTVIRVLEKVVHSIAVRFKHLISLPETVEEIRTVKQGFYSIARFPRCIGALDCTHVRIISPVKQDPENYRNQKGFFSYNVQAICDSELKIQNIVCRWPGAAHDARIFDNSVIRAKFENSKFGDSVLVADSAYGIKPYLITPLNNPETPAERLFNESQIQTRNPVGRCFEVWKQRFPILELGIQLEKHVGSIVVATAALHNLAIIMKDPVPAVDPEIQAAIDNLKKSDIPLQQDSRNNSTRIALIKYFEYLV